jgi:hypothetical protein
MQPFDKLARHSLSKAHESLETCLRLLRLQVSHQDKASTLKLSGSCLLVVNVGFAAAVPRRAGRDRAFGFCRAWINSLHDTFCNKYCRSASASDISSNELKWGLIMVRKSYTYCRYRTQAPMPLFEKTSPSLPRSLTVVIAFPRCPSPPLSSIWVRYRCVIKSILKVYYIMHTKPWWDSTTYSSPTTPCPWVHFFCISGRVLEFWLECNTSFSFRLTCYGNSLLVSMKYLDDVHCFAAMFVSSPSSHEQVTVYTLNKEVFEMHL